MPTPMQTPTSTLSEPSDPNDPNDPILGPDGEEIVFQVHHVNFAWGRTSSGFFINARGEVRSFDSFDTPEQVQYPLALDIAVTVGMFVAFLVVGTLMFVRADRDR